MKKKSLIFAFVLGSVLLFLVGCRAVVPNNPIPYDNAPTANTTEMVDYLSKVAKEDAKSTAVSDSVAIDFIRNTYPNFYTDNATMEKAMYYGYLLEYRHQEDSTDYYQNITKLGMDTEQAVKYVYRGVEAVDDDATQENLKQISESLAEIK